MFDREFILIMILCVPLYMIGLMIHDKRKFHKEIKELPIKTYIQKVVRSINSMDGYDFECFVAFVYKELGYYVKQTKQTNDGGYDLVLVGDKFKKIYVEIKRYSSENKIGRPLLQKLVGATASLNGSKCIFLTTSSFNSNAIEYARTSKNVDIELIDIDGFLDMCKKVNQSKVLEYLGYNVEYSFAK